MATCDAAGADGLAGPPPVTPRALAMADYAGLLSRAPWRLDAATLGPMRAAGLDDRALLEVIAVASSQNTASRPSLAGVVTD